ncbi:hypothetical protein [Streptococcus gwangjuensis]|jgi:hypothetical protein|uniref:hypothetical protein n=1 Tax=Streptococcus gwangjuensis TaxID=1433513 RepID=UPI0023054A78|nr:hypothetical protein [Streptococcus gwangjuense]MDB0075210.1 hypothetical protein [Streptococcus gwangjuense]
MAFSIRKFNNAEIPVDAKELLGKLQFISFIENFKMVDGSPVDYPTHAEVFSDKMQEIIPVKLEEGISVEDIPMMSEVELVGDVTIWIYEDSYTISRGNNNVSEVKGHAFALRAENVKRVGGGQPKQEQKQDQKSEQKQEHKG